VLFFGNLRVLPWISDFSPRRSLSLQNQLNECSEWSCGFSVGVLCVLVPQIRETVSILLRNVLHEIPSFLIFQASRDFGAL